MSITFARPEPHQSSHLGFWKLVLRMIGIRLMASSAPRSRCRCGPRRRTRSWRRSSRACAVSRTPAAAPNLSGQRACAPPRPGWQPRSPSGIATSRAGNGDRSRRESDRRPAQRAYQLHVELGVAYRARGPLADALREFDAAARAPAVRVRRADPPRADARGRGPRAEAGKAFRAAWQLDPGDPVKAYLRDAAAGRSRRAGARSGARAADRHLPRVLAARSDPAARSGRAVPFVTLDAIPDNLSRTPVVADSDDRRRFRAARARIRYSDAVAAFERAARQTEAPATLRPPISRGATRRAGEPRRRRAARISGRARGSARRSKRAPRRHRDGSRKSRAIRQAPSRRSTQALAAQSERSDIHKELASAYAAEGRRTMRSAS